MYINARHCLLTLFISLMFLGIPAFAAPTLLTLDSQSSVKLGGWVEYIRETGTKLELPAVLQARDAQWQSTTGPGFLVLGLGEDAYWFRFSLQATSDKPWQLTLRYFFNGDADVFLVPRADSSTVLPPENVLVGRASNWNDRHYTLSLPLVTGQIYDAYLRVHVPGPDKFAFVIEDHEAKKHFDLWDNRWVGVFYGGFATMLLFNLFLAISTRSFTYGFYLLYMVSMLSYLMMMDGLIQAELSRYYIAICAIVAFGCQFCRLFLRTSTALPGADRFIRWLIGTALVLGASFVILGSLELLKSMVMVLVAGYGLVLGGVGLLSRLRGNHVARFFLLAWMFPLMGMLYTDLMFLGIVPFTDVGYSAMNIATLLEAILLSMALADRINMLRVQRQRAVVDAKQKLEMSNSALEKANRLKDSFLGTISHELRTPMNGIIGTLELLKSTSVDQHQRECLTTLEHSSAHMLSMVERILLFSELQSGSVRVQTSALEVATWRQKIKQYWTPMFTAKGLRFSIYIDAGCNDWVGVDSKKLDYLINELLSNALKFTSQGDVTLEIQQKNTGTEAQWMLEVTDNGVGIPAEQLQLITESFRQGQSTYNRQYGGLGIGMAICKELVTALSGEWRVQSAQGAGTRISIVIPILPATMPAMAPSMPGQTVNPATPQNTAKDVTTAPNIVMASASAVDVMPRPETKEGALIAPTSAAALKPPAILVVEDNVVNQMVMKKILESLGWTYCIVNNGVEAVEKAREKPFALILMDCQMPVMDGFAATESIRAGENLNQATPIVAVTANATDQDRDHCMASGMNDYLKKPVKPNDIKGIIDRYVVSDALAAAGQSG